MKMVFRWFGAAYDSVSLKQIRQIPGVTGIAGTLLGIPAGEVWPLDAVRALRDETASAGLETEVIESVNIHEDIKLGLPSRDAKIAAYIETMKNLKTIGVKCICYNFMPVLDWARSHLSYALPDGSTTMFYQHNFIEQTTPAELAVRYAETDGGFTQPGWEPERLAAIDSALTLYAKMPEEQYWQNMKYFLDAVIPYAEQLDIKMAIHPDDPPWPIFGLPRYITGAEGIRKFLSLNTSPYNGLTLCTGSLGANKNNDVPAIIREFYDRIHFAHIRNLKFINDRDFYESAHMSSCGSLNMLEIVKAFKGFEGYVRPDHGRMIFGEQARHGYGLYDRALGATYLQGLWEAVNS